MNRRLFYTIGLILCVVLFFGSMFLPKTMGDIPAMIGGICMVCFPIFLIALIVSGIRLKKTHKSESQTPVQHAAPTPIPSPTPAPALSPKTAPAPIPSENKKIKKIERVHVRGISFYTKNVESVGWENPDYSLTKKELAESFEDERVYQYSFSVKGSLVPEPDNEHDPNAIMVQADGLCIGHVPAGSTAHIKKLMESGRIDHMELNIGGGKYKEVYENDDGKYELDKGEINYSAVLELYLRDEIAPESE